jgi:hypothetical protein
MMLVSKCRRHCCRHCWHCSRFFCSFCWTPIRVTRVALVDPGL